MKKFKRIASLAVMLLVLCGLMLLAVSCDDDSNDDSQGGTTSSTQGGTTSSTQGGGTTTPSQGGTTSSTQGGGTTTPSQGGTTDSTTNPDTGTLKENEVRVTVRYENGKPVKGADVQICQGTNCFFFPIITGDNGVGTNVYDGLTNEVLKAKVRSIGNSEYLVPSAEAYVYFEEGSREIVITIAEITVNVIDNNEEGVESAAVQVYQGEHAFTNVIYTDADGVAYGYIAVSGETISAVVTEVDGSDDYVLSKTPVEFEDGEYECTVNVEKSSAYEVRLVQLVGGAPLANVKIELYKKGSSMVQKTRYTDANGVARFEDVKPGEYSVKVVFENPAYFISRDTIDGKYAFDEGSTELEFIVTETPVITYTVKVPTSVPAGSYLSVFDGDHNYINSIAVGDNGTATFEGKNGDYIVVYYPEDEKYYSPVIFEKDKTASGEVKMIDAKAGSSKDTPITAVSGAFISGEGTVWFAIPFHGNKTVVVENYGDSFVITWPNGDKTKVDAGTVEFDSLEADGNVLVFSVSLEGEVSGNISVSAPGTYGAPFDVNELIGDDIDGKEIELPSSVGDIYYEYTFKENGTITINVSGTSATIYIDGKMIDSYIEDGKTKISYPAMAGEKIKFQISSADEDATVSFEVKEVKKTYTATVFLDFVEAEGVVVVLYRMADGDLVEIARVTTDAKGIANFGELVYSGDYAVKVVTPENYEEQLSAVYFEYGSTTSVYVSHVKDGSHEYPMEFDTFEDSDDSVSLDKGESLWYTLYIMPSHIATLVIDSANVQFVVYFEDTNGDGVVDEKDTPYGTSQIVDGKATFAFADNEREYVIKVSSIDGEAVNAGYDYLIEEPEEGSGVDYAKEVDDGFGDVVTMTEGQVVYYRYSGGPCKLTVTVEGDNVVLVRILRSLDGDTEETVEDNVLVIEDTMYDSIFFAIKATAETTVEIGASAEARGE